MKIEPVYLVAPPPAVPSMPTRRAFLIASGTFATGALVGGACGYTVGAATATPPSAPASPSAIEELPKSGDADLDELRRLAVNAPLDELFAKAIPFLSLRVSTYPKDEIAWRGVDRMSTEIVENATRRVDPIVIADLVAQIEGVARPGSPSLRERVPRLRERRAEERRNK